MTTTCLNCDAEVSGAYCAECGQSAHVGKITFKETIDQFLSSAFAIEGPFLRTLIGILVHPGKVFKEFLDGKRKTYYKPVGYTILISAVYIILRELIDYDPLEGQFQKVKAHSESAKSFAALSKEAAYWMVKNINNIMLILVFGIALMMKLFYRKRRYLAEYVAIGFYITGTYILFGIPLMFIGKYTTFNPHQWQIWFFLILCAYATFKFFEGNLFVRLTKAILISGLSYLTYVVLAFMVSLIVVLFT